MPIAERDVAAKVSFAARDITMCGYESCGLIEDKGKDGIDALADFLKVWSLGQHLLAKAHASS